MVLRVSPASAVRFGPNLAWARGAKREAAKSGRVSARKARPARNGL